MQARSGEIKAWNKFRPERVLAHDVRDTGAVLYHLSYQANWELANYSLQFKYMIYSLVFFKFTWRDSAYDLRDSENKLNVSLLRTDC